MHLKATKKVKGFLPLHCTLKTAYKIQQLHCAVIRAVSGKRQGRRRAA